MQNVSPLAMLNAYETIKTGQEWGSLATNWGICGNTSNVFCASLHIGLLLNAMWWKYASFAWALEVWERVNTVDHSQLCMMCKLFTPSEICSSVWGLWKVLCLDSTYIRPFSSSCEEKEDLCTSLFSWLLPLAIPSSHYSRAGTAGASPRIQNSSLSSTFSLLIATGFSYVFVVRSLPSLSEI